MKAQLVTTKTSAEALRLVRILAGATGELQYQVMERLLKGELAVLKKANKL